jgi:predicted phosphodiesterase
VKISDTLIVVLSDMHSGGSTALFPNKFWQFKHSNHTPDEKQKAIYQHFTNCIAYARDNRKNRRLIVVHDGDAVEGIHHNSIQNITFNKDEQAEIHLDLMDTFLRGVKFDQKKGDKLYYVSGTESHTGETEDVIAKDLGAEDGKVFDFLSLNVNGRNLWFLHHGKKRGMGANEGNALRNWLRDIYWECKKSESIPPDMIVSGHTHTPSWNTYIARGRDGFHMIHGVICPSWQAKTRFAWKVAPVDRNEIGAVYIDITAGGDIRAPKFLLQETKGYEVVKA